MNSGYVYRRAAGLAERLEGWLKVRYRGHPYLGVAKRYCRRRSASFSGCTAACVGAAAIKADEPPHHRKNLIELAASAVGSYSVRIFPFRVAQLRDARARGGKFKTRDNCPNLISNREMPR
jgi:hypothetical protein